MLCGTPPFSRVVDDSLLFTLTLCVWSRRNAAFHDGNSISKDEEVIHIIKVFIIIICYHDLFCQRLLKNLTVICVYIIYMFLKYPWPHTIYVQF